MSREIEIIVGDDGAIRMIYDDDLTSELAKQGKLQVQRASHVEPSENGGWVADLSPVGGPCLGPFDLRKDALTAEVNWLKENNTPVPQGMSSESEGEGYVSCSESRSGNS